MKGRSRKRLGHLGIFILHDFNHTAPAKVINRAISKEKRAEADGKIL